MKRLYFIGILAIAVSLFSLPVVAYAQPQPAAPGKMQAAPTAPMGPMTGRAYEPVAALIDLRTSFSDGIYDPEALVRMASGKGFKVVIINDHDRVVMEYGLPPFRNIVKKKVELNSINRMGAESYLHAIRETRKRHPDMILIPGTESTPFYYWTGSPFSGTLTANDPERRILTIGLEKPEDYETLPVLHNGLSEGHLRKAWPALAAFGICFLISLTFVLRHGWWRVSGVLLTLVSAAFFVNALFTRPSPFDPYQGKQGAAPYQLFIDDVGRKGGLTFWNYPETHSGVRTLGPIKVSTPPYPGMLLETRDYTGFAALYGDTATVTDPGNVWDEALREYCAGYRKRPPWGIATSDFHKEDGAGEKLGNFQTVLWLTERSAPAALDALRTGRMYAARGSFPRVPQLDEFSVSADRPDDVLRAISGQDVTLSGKPRIRIAVSGVPGESGNGKRSARLRLIRSGTVIHTAQGPLPFQVDFTDSQASPGEKFYYRMDLTGDGAIISNPIFVRLANSSVDPAPPGERTGKARAGPEMIVAVHQPQYLPWLGFFDKMDRADIFVLLDTVQFKKNEWQNRNRIKTAVGPQWLTVPVTYRFPQRIDEVGVNNRERWQRRQRQAILTNYRQAPCWDFVAPLIDELLTPAWERLSPLNVLSVAGLAKLLGIATPLFVASELPPFPEDPDRRLIAIAQYFGADTYLAGSGGRDYMALDLYRQSGINVAFQEYRHPVYEQRFGPFVPFLSALDLLFNHGPASLTILRGER